MTDLILHIDTASPRAIVMLSSNGRILGLRENLNAYDHAAFVQPAVRSLMDECSVGRQQIQCIAVANGPGSYTGLRVGLASAKGLCFAWKKPLITLSGLQIMALALRTTLAEQNMPEGMLVPMLDARRMEVFFGMYRSQDIKEVIAPSAAIIDEKFLSSELREHMLYITGSGAAKWQSICTSTNATFIPEPTTDFAFAQLALEHSVEKKWADLAYSEPFYTKDHYTPSRSGK